MDILEKLEELRDLNTRHANGIMRFQLYNNAAFILIIVLACGKGATKEKRDTKLIELKGSLQLDFYLSSFGLCNATCEMHMACLVTLSLKTKKIKPFTDVFP